MVDKDIAGVFPNVPLHNSLQAYSSVDLLPFKDTIFKVFPKVKDTFDETRLRSHWTRLCFRWNQSLELVTTFYYLTEEFIRGDHRNVNNPLRWDNIVLNLIGNPYFDPTISNVFKWYSITSRITGGVLGYVDDLQAIGFWSKRG